MIVLQASTIIQERLHTYIYIPIMIWLALIVIYLIFLSAKFTFGNWTKENPNPYSSETMGLPRGVMRGILTLSLLFGVLLLEIFAIENPQFEGHIEQFIVAFQMMLAFYFGSKVMHHLASVDKTKSVTVANTIARVEETKASGTVPSEADGEFDDPEAEG